MSYFLKLLVDPNLKALLAFQANLAKTAILAPPAKMVTQAAQAPLVLLVQLESLATMALLVKMAIRVAPDLRVKLDSLATLEHLAKTATPVAQAQLDLTANPAPLVIMELLVKTGKMDTPVDLVFQARMASPDLLAITVIKI